MEDMGLVPPACPDSLLSSNVPHVDNIDHNDLLLTTQGKKLSPRLQMATSLALSDYMWF